LCSNLGEAADALGYSWRQCQRWFASYRRGGLQGLLKSTVDERGRQELVTPEAFEELQEAMKRGEIATIGQAHRFLSERGIEYSHPDGVGHLLRRLRRSSSRRAGCGTRRPTPNSRSRASLRSSARLKWNAAQDVASDEANELAGIFWFAHALPQPEGRHIQELARSYAQVVVEEEWPLMEQGRSSPKAWATLDELRATILGLDPPTGAQQVRYNQVLEQLHGLGDARRERLLAASEGLSTILWVVLIGGGVITIAFTYLFGLDNTVVHTLMVAALAMILSLSLFTVAALDYPFKGDVRIHPAAFEQVLERFQESKLSDL
jgi:transposase